MRWWIYALADPRTGEVRYVGVSINPRRRYSAHLHSPRAKKNRDRNTWKARWVGLLTRLGLRPLLRILDEGKGDGWAAAETRWIRFYRDAGARLCNASDGGEGALGASPSEETRAKMAEAQRRLAGANRIGKRHTEDTKARISAAKRGVPNESARVRQLGKKQPPELIEKRRAGLVGHVVSAETKAKISAARRAWFARRLATGLRPRDRWA